MIRIIAGIKKGKKLQVPKAAKPITDRIKTSIFDLIRDFLPQAHVLDLFSGSGNFAIEALSRGAMDAVIVELDPEAIKIIKQNVESCDYKLAINIIKGDVLSFLQHDTKKFDIIMLDPPFPIPSINKERLLKLSLSHLVPGGIIIFRYPAQEKYTVNRIDAEIVYTKKYGISIVSFIAKKQQQESI